MNREAYLGFVHTQRHLNKHAFMLEYGNPEIYLFSHSKPTLIPIFLHTAIISTYVDSTLMGEVFHGNHELLMFISPDLPTYNAYAHPVRYLHVHACTCNNHSQG